MKNPENKLEIVKAIAKAHADRLRDNAARGRVQAEKCGLTPKEIPGFMRGWNTETIKGARATLDQIIRIIEEK